VRTYAVRLTDEEFGPEFSSSAEAGTWARDNLMSDDDHSGSWEIVYLREGKVVGSCMHISFRT
jgi:hypothetical protein